MASVERAASWTAGATGLRRPLVDDGDQEPIYTNLNEWKFRRTLSFWVAVCFTKGTLLFLWVPICKIHGLTINQWKVDEELQYALTKFPYLSGSTLFLVGCYMGYLELINMGEEREESRIFFRRWFCPRRKLVTEKGVACSSIVGWVSYLIGAILYQISVVSDLFYEPPRHLKWWQWPTFLVTTSEVYTVTWPTFLGGLFFFIGGICEVVHNSSWKKCPVTVVWWVSVTNCLGGLAFWMSSSPTAMKLLNGIPVKVGLPARAQPDLLVVLVGCVLYLIGSVLSIWMWRGQRFGLALLSILNEEHAVVVKKGKMMKDPEVVYTDPAVMEKLDDKEVMHPKISLNGLTFVFLWILVGAAETIALSALTTRLPPFTKFPTDVYSGQAFKFWRRLNSQIWHAGIIFLVYMILVYSSAVPSLPREKPFRQLVLITRFAVFPALFTSALSIFIIFFDFRSISGD